MIPTRAAGMAAHVLHEVGLGDRDDHKPDTNFPVVNASAWRSPRAW